MSKPALGRGLNALLGSSAKPSPAPATSPRPAEPAAAGAPAAVSKGPPGVGVRTVPLDQIRTSPLQPRKDFDEQALRDLADSIRGQGVVQPLIVRAVAGAWELIAGERRWRAARMAGLVEVPVLERAATDLEVLELALVENLQRENLNPLEEALGYAQLQSQFNLTQEQVAQKVGRGRVVVANALRLLKLPPSVQESLRNGQLSVGHAKVILGLPDARAQEKAAQTVLARGMTVRQTEELVASMLAAPKPGDRSPKPPVAAARDPHVADIENRLRERLSTQVGLRYRGGKGAVEIRFSSDDELSRILEVIGVSID